MVWLDAQEFGKNMVRKLVTRKSGEEVKRPTPKCTPSVYIFVSICMLTQKQSQQRRLLTIIQAKWLVLWSQPAFFPSHCSPCSWTKWPSSKVGGYSSAQLLSTAEWPLCQNIDQHWALDMASFLGVISQLPVAHWLDETFPLWKVQHFILTGSDTLPFCVHTICILSICFIYCHSTAHSISSYQRNCLTANVVHHWAHVHEIHWYDHSLSH